VCESVSVRVCVSEREREYYAPSLLFPLDFIIHEAESRDYKAPHCAIFFISGEQIDLL
jgi:hypothetical protein